MVTSNLLSQLDKGKCCDSISILSNLKFLPNVRDQVEGEEDESQPRRQRKDRGRRVHLWFTHTKICIYYGAEEIRRDLISHLKLQNIRNPH